MISPRFSVLLLILFASFNLTAETNLSPEDQKAMRELELEINPLKEKVHETKARVHELEEAVLRGKMTGSKALITFENEAEGFFSFASAEFYLDDQLIKKVVADKGRKTLEKTDIFDSDIPSGEHTLRVKLTYTGSDRSIYTLFTYFKDHQFNIDTREKFDVEYGKTTVVKLVALDKGYFKKSPDERLFLEVKVVRDWGTEPPD